MLVVLSTFANICYYHDLGRRNVRPSSDLANSRRTWPSFPTTLWHARDLHIEYMTASSPGKCKVRLVHSIHSKVYDFPNLQSCSDSSSSASWLRFSRLCLLCLRTFATRPTLRVDHRTESITESTTRNPNTLQPRSLPRPRLPPRPARLRPQRRSRPVRVLHTTFTTPPVETTL